MSLEAKKIPFGELNEDEAHEIIPLLLERLQLEIWAMKWDGEPRYFELRGRDPFERR